MRSGKPRRPREVFISHSGRDRAFVVRLARRLRACGIRTWYSEAHLVGAQQWHDEIGRALRRCDWFLLVLSPAALKSMWVKLEFVYARQVPRYKGRIVPILHKPCNPLAFSWTLAAAQRVDFTKGFENGCRELLRIWGLGQEPKTAGWHTS
jgi:hypothetical protein